MSFKIVLFRYQHKFFTCIAPGTDMMRSPSILPFLCYFEEKHDDRLTSSTRRLIRHDPLHLLPRCYPISLHSKQRNGRYIFEEETEGCGNLDSS